MKPNGDKTRYRKLLKREDPEKEKEFNLATFDIETEYISYENPHPKFFVGSVTTRSANGSFDTRLFDDMSKLFAHLLTLKDFLIYAHNGSGFDYLYILPYLQEIADVSHIIKPQLQGDKIIGFYLLPIDGIKPEALDPTKRSELSFIPETIQLRDSFTIFGTSLAKVTESFCPEFPKLKRKGTFEEVPFNINDPDDVEYVKRDTESLLVALERFYAFCYDQLGVYPAWTGGSTALKAWKRMIPDGHLYEPLPKAQRHKEEFIRRAYYGGYVFPGSSTIRIENYSCVDFHAAYAARMAMGVPMGIGKWTCQYMPGNPGFYEVRVDAPLDLKIPVIPKQTDKGLVWPVGRYTSFTTDIEIELARKVGCSVEVVRGVWYDRLEFPFNAFVDKCKELEHLGGANKPIAKMMRNSLYGKYCMKREIENIIITKEYITDTNYKPEINKETGEVIANSYLHVEKNTANYILPQWGAYITARQRVALIEAANAIGDVAYMDTDSLTAPTQNILKAAEAGHITLGAANYGDLDVEKDYVWFQVLAPKTYWGDTIGGKHIRKAKGLSLKNYTPQEQDGFFTDANNGIFNPQKFGSMHSIRSQLRRTDDFISTGRRRGISNILNSEGWDYDPITRKITPKVLHEF